MKTRYLKGFRAWKSKTYEHKPHNNWHQEGLECVLFKNIFHCTDEIDAYVCWFGHVIPLEQRFLKYPLKWQWCK